MSLDLYLYCSQFCILLRNSCNSAKSRVHKNTFESMSENNLPSEQSSGVLNESFFQVLFFLRFYSYLYVCRSENGHMCADAHRNQKKALVPQVLEFQVVVSHWRECWESNSSPLERQQVLLTTEPSSLQLPLSKDFIRFFMTLSEPSAGPRSFPLTVQQSSCCFLKDSHLSTLALGSPCALRLLAPPS